MSYDKERYYYPKARPNYRKKDDSPIIDPIESAKRRDNFNQALKAEINRIKKVSEMKEKEQQEWEEIVARDGNDFSSMVENVRVSREKKAIEEEAARVKREKEWQTWNKEHQAKKAKTLDERTNSFLAKYGDTIINKTFELFMSNLKKRRSSPYNASYTFEERILYEEAETSLLETKIMNRLLNKIGNIPNSKLTVSVKDRHIEHTHYEGDAREGEYVLDRIEWRLVVEITFNF